MLGTPREQTSPTPTSRRRRHALTLAHFRRFRQQESGFFGSPAPRGRRPAPREAHIFTHSNDNARPSMGRAVTIVPSSLTRRGRRPVTVGNVLPTTTVDLRAPLKLAGAGNSRVLIGEIRAVVVERAVRQVLPVSLPARYRPARVDADAGGNRPLGGRFGVQDQREPRCKKGGH